MSPVHAMERGYTAIKEMLREGVFASGARLEANRLAHELGISMTPVRDALYRLSGEQLVDTTMGDGFHVPRFSEAALRDLYEWQSVLMAYASRTVDIRMAMANEDDMSTIADRAAALIERVAEFVPNREVGSALIAVSNRLHPFRIAESAIFDDLEAELKDLLPNRQGVSAALRRYHLRRVRAVPALLRQRDI